MNKRKIRAMVFFGLCMTFLAYFIYWAGSAMYWYSITEPWAPETTIVYVPGTIITGIITVVFLGLYLTTKSKRGMF